MFETINKDFIVFEDGDCYIVLSENPVVDGHAIISTKNHYNTFDQVPKTTRIKLIKLLQIYVRILKEHYSFPGYSILQHGGKVNNYKQYYFEIFPRKNYQSFAYVYDSEITSMQILSHEIEEKIIKAFEHYQEL